MSVSSSSFKSCYKKHYFHQANPFHSFKLENANIYQTRLRLGLSHLRAHLFTYNRIDDPLCQQCKLENETTEHYVLRCPNYTVPRMKYLQGFSTHFYHGFVAGWTDESIVSLFLYGNPELGDDLNEMLFTMARAQTYIIDTSRFSSGEQ